MIGLVVINRPFHGCDIMKSSYKRSCVLMSPSTQVGLAVFFLITGQNAKEYGMEAKLYVGNMSYDTTEQGLRELFMQAGNVVSATVIKEPGTNRSKGFGFVEMSSQSEAQKAISMFNGYTLNDRQLTVNVARPREERGGGGGFRPQQRGGHRRDNRGGGNRRY